MARPLRIEYAGAFYHITSRGNARANIYDDDVDRLEFLSLLADTCKDFTWRCHAYCLMSNHYHLLVETGRPSLSHGMRFLNGVYSQRYNRRHDRVGHLFQGRFKGILIDSDAYLLELARYIVLNPVRAQMVRCAAEWPWSSYHSTAGLAEAGPCQTTDVVLSRLSTDRASATRQYKTFVTAGSLEPGPWQSLKNQIYLGSDEFVERSLSKIRPDQSLADIPKPQTQTAPKPMIDYLSQYPEHKEAMVAAYLSGHYSLTEIGRHFGVSRMTVRRAVDSAESVRCAT